MSNRVVTCGCAVIELDHKPGEPTIFDKGYETIKQLFRSKPVSSETKAATREHSHFASHPIHA